MVEYIEGQEYWYFQEAVRSVTLTASLPQVVVRRRGASNNYYGRRCTPVSMDAYSMDSVSVYHSFRRKSKRRASGRSMKSYLNQAFDDPVSGGVKAESDMNQAAH